MSEQNAVPSTLAERNMQTFPGLWKRVIEILTLSRPYRGRLVAAIALSLVSVVASLMLPLGVRTLIDTILKRPNRDLLDRLALGLFALFVVRASLRLLGSYLLRSTGERIVADLRMRVYSHLQSLSFRFFVNQPTGDLTSRLTNDVASVRAAATDSVAAGLLQGARFIGSVTAMAALNWRLCALVLTVMPLATIMGQHFGKKLRRIARQVQDSLAESTVIAAEAIGGIRVVKAFARELYEVRRYSSAVECVYLSSRRSALIGSVCGSAIDLLFMSITVGIFWYGGTEVLAGRLSGGDLVAFLFYSQNVSQSVAEITTLYASLNAAAGASERLFEILKMPMEAAGEVAVPPCVKGSIAFKSVQFDYGSKEVLKDISFSVLPGETVALVGHSGAGKSTVLSLIARFYEPTGGRILLDGRDLQSMPPQLIREHIALVMQDVELFSASIRENIRYGRLDATDLEIESAAKAANAHEFIQEFPQGYDTQVGERGLKLSGGQRQRISIARALLKQAPILLLDEATSAIDTASEMLIQESMERLKQTHTVIVVAHRLTTVRHADRILVLEGGEIIEGGSHTELMERRGSYYMMATHQSLDVDPDRTSLWLRTIEQDA